ncbi:hypothetical protein like AT5G25950 [Hibiscus trionum]|uniref:Neprosin PEP catalytic domain-containing protein n=1 Tax=Hibiscus trionum TaxID=183268 RepID=A0A9W7I412_HIBTR|nr:hypothetical protein like AT5G25950 [Hibiscus trionum]
MTKLNISGLFLVLVLSYLSDRANGRVDFNGIVDEKLKQLNKPAVKTIQSEDGDIIDCVDIYKQPAFDHPALKNHVIQMKPSFVLNEEKSSTKNELSSKLVVSQTWQRSGSCPDGTVPIRRIQRKDLLRAESIFRFGRKPQEIVSKSNTTIQKDGHIPFINNTKLSLPSLVNRAAATLVTVGYNYIGAKGDINVWNPNVAAENEFTTGQIWVKAGPGDDFESLESGWVVNPQLYGDRRTRFFAHWTKDSYKSTGCFDLTCSGFVHTNPQIALGAAIEPVSSESGQQYHVTIGIYMDPNTANWWLKIGADQPVGYWPAGSLLFYLNHSSTLVEWGGQVYSTNVKKSPHTKTAMGSGDYAYGLFGNACFVQNPNIVDFSLSLKYPEWVGTWADDYNCYSALNYQKAYGTLPVFYFGGPGQNHNCP